MTTLKSKKEKEFEALIKPLMRWLRENHHPHVTVLVNSTNAEVLEGLYNVVLPCEEPHP